ncbi:MAG: HAD family phosphatase [Microthrixaceae bacterium]|nr:HAD family phosphatase [Microthrixaceae bacterium]
MSETQATPAEAAMTQARGHASHGTAYAEVAASTRPVLVALDIDGTLLHEDESLSEGIVEAIRGAEAAGHTLMLATGRSWNTVERIMRELGLEPEYVVASNGAVVLRRDPADASGYAPYQVETFEPAAVLTLLREHLPDARYMVERPDGRRMYTADIPEWELGRAQQVPLEAMMEVAVSRVVVVSPRHDNGEFLRLVEGIGLHQVSYSVGFSSWLDIAPDGVNKGTALEQVRTWLGFAPADVLVIGDGRNDLEMFAWARNGGGRAYAMGQSPREVLDAATHVTATVGDGGASRVLRELARGR